MYISMIILHENSMKLASQKDRLCGNIICRFMKNEQQKERQIDWLSNEYHNKHLDFCCKEFNIYYKVHYYDEYAVKPSIRTFDRGVSKDKA